MRLLSLWVIMCLFVPGAVSFVVPAAAHAQVRPDIGEDHAQTPGQQRLQLKTQLHELEAAGAATSDDVHEREAYIAVLSALGYHDRAAEGHEILAAQYPERGDLWRAAGAAWMSTGPAACDKAFAALGNALALDEDDVEARAMLARLLHREGLYEQAERQYAQVLQRDPGHIPAQLGMAALIARTGAVVESSARIDALGAKAQAYDVETRLMLRKALFDFERRGGWIDDEGENHAAYARLLYRAGRITDAVLAARRATALTPDDYATWNFFAAMQLQLGNIEQAERAYAQSLEANPDQPQIAEARKQLINQMTIEQRVKAP